MKTIDDEKQIYCNTIALSHYEAILPILVQKYDYRDLEAAITETIAALKQGAILLIDNK